LVAHTLRAEGFDASEDRTGRGTPLIAFGISNNGEAHFSEELMGTLQATARGGGRMEAIAFTERTRAGERQLEAQPDLAYALDNPGAGGRAQTRQVMTPAAQVRRLTPTECERLQGYPDGYTCLCGRSDGRSVGDAPCTCADGPRYRALGNAVAVPVVTKSAGGTGRLDGDSETFVVSRPLLGKPNSSHDESKETYVAHTLRGEGFDSSEDGTGRGTPIVAVRLDQFGSNGSCISEDIAPTQDGRPPAVLAFDTTQITSAQNYSNPQSGDPCHPLAAGAHPPAIAFTERTRDGDRQLEAETDLAYALDNPGAGGRAQTRQVLTPAMSLRRLTPTECERLQGLSWRDPETGEWQDGWTCLCDRNRGRSVGENPCICKDGPRYRAIGDGLAIPVAAWVLRCVAEAEDLLT
jgi:DNA (cytosine-5)-methyltransferase 1